MFKVNDIRIELRPTKALVPNARNARSHSKAQIAQIARSIREFGFIVPVIIGRNREILAGHGRVLAAECEGLNYIPTISVEHLTEAQRRAFILADNKIALNASWSEELLAVELRYLSDVDVDIDPCITGFSVGEIDLIIENASDDTEEEGPVPDVPPLEHTVSRATEGNEAGDDSEARADHQRPFARTNRAGQ